MAVRLSSSCMGPGGCAGGAVGRGASRTLAWTCHRAGGAPTGVAAGTPHCGDDPGLRVLLADAAKAPLTPLGRVWLRNELVRRSLTEARLEDELHRRPALIGALVPLPLIVLGLPRTGTTLAAYAVGCVPAAFVLPFWQLRRPYPIPSGRLDRMGRILRAAAMARLAQLMAPRLRDIHPVPVLRPEEDVFLFRDTGMLAVPVAAPGYLRWLQETDSTSGYRTCRRHPTGVVAPSARAAAGAEVPLPSRSPRGIAGRGAGGDGGMDPPRSGGGPGQLVQPGGRARQRLQPPGRPGRAGPALARLLGHRDGSGAGGPGRRRSSPLPRRHVRGAGRRPAR